MNCPTRSTPAMKKSLIAVALFLSAGQAHAAESLNDWGPWAVDYDVTSRPGYDVEDYDFGVDKQIPMASDLDNSFTLIGPVESALSDVGGTINDIIEEVLELNPGTSIDDIVAKLPADLGSAGSNVSDVVNAVDALLP